MPRIRLAVKTRLKKRSKRSFLKLSTRNSDAAEVAEAEE
jgi:hypothetical protein